MTNTPKSRSIAATSKGLEKVRNKMAELKKPEDLGNRGKKSWTQKDLAEKSYVEISTVKRFLKGIAVDESSVLSICNALDLDINEIVDPKECNPPDPDKPEINWRQICHDILTEQQKNQRLRRQATELGCELNVYVPLGLLERKQQQRRNESVPKDDVYQLNQQVIVKEYENQQFLTEVIQGGNDQRLAIIGEPGAGKTTLLDKIASWIDNHNLGLPICIPLGGLQGETLAGYLLKIWLKQAAKSEATQENLAASLEQQFRSGKVWLLLDAVDEMAAASPAEALAKIRDELVGWVAEARVVLTCRLNVWDASVNNALPGFETYRTLEFKPEQVDEFIGEWFAKAEPPQPPLLRGEKVEHSLLTGEKVEHSLLTGEKTVPPLNKGGLGGVKRAEKLLAKLKETNRANIYNLVRNPLRLALLCQTFYLSPDEELPETQAMLYERFIRYFYEWKQEQHSTTRAQRQHLNQVLGELAKAGIESESRFRLRESWAIQLMGESQFKLAEKLGWLNLVDRDAKTDEAVYAFFHPTFQEYFAAKAIEDWHFFLHHVPDNPKLGIYRIFERRWKDVMLLWVGRDDVLVEQKEGFIKALIEFEDGCKDFYEKRAYFLASGLIAEFKDCSLADVIVAQIVKWGFGYFNVEKQEWQTFFDAITEGAKEALKEAEREKSITALVELIGTSQDEETRKKAGKSLQEIGKENPVEIAALVKLIGTSQDKSTRRKAAESLGEIDKDNPVAIAALVELIGTSQDESTRRLAAESLGLIGKDNPVAITALVELIGTSQDEETRRRAAYSLWQSDKENPFAIAALVELIGTSQDEHTQWQAALSLQKIGKENPVAISALVELIGTSQDESTRRQAAESLGKIDKDNPVAIAALVELIGTSQDEPTQWRAAYSLGQIGKDNPVAIAALAELIGTSQDEPTWKQGAYSLGQIGKDNPVAIAALSELIGTSQDEDTQWRAAYSLGKIDKDNPVAIAALVELLGTSQDEDTWKQGAYSLGQIGKDNPVAIAALVELLGTSQDEDTWKLAAESLGKVGKDNPVAIAALVELIGTSQDEDTWKLAAESLGKVGKDNPVAIAALVELIGTSQDESTRRLAAYSLGKIDKDNPVAIAALVELIGTSQDKYTPRQAADSLGQIGKDNPVAIAALVELIGTSQDESTRRLAADSLRQIGKENPVAIAALVELLGTSQDESIWKQAADSLGQIGKENPVAIAALVELIGTSQSPSTQWQVTYSLQKIGKDNPVAIAALVELIGTSQDGVIRWAAAESLGKILTLSQQIAGVVTALKDYLSDETYNNDFDRFKNCYKLLWKCAQNLPYPNFYEAWHHPPTTPHPEVLETTAASATPTTITLNWQTFPQDIARAINNDANLSHHLKPISIDINKFLDPDNPAAKIYSEMLLQGCPKSQDSKPKTLAELQTYWDELRIESDISPLLIFYDSQTGTENATAFSNTFLKALSKFDGFICAVCDAGEISLPTFSPSQPNLIANMVGWMREKVMES